MKQPFAIESESDLEVILLKESHGFLATLMHPDIYEVAGSKPDQSISFKSHAAFELFLVLATEFFSEGTQNYRSGQSYKNMSIYEGIGWFCNRHRAEAKRTGLVQAYRELRSWVECTHEYEFWCGEVSKDLILTMSRKDLINFCSNTTKHHILRLTKLLSRLQRLYRAHGNDLTDVEVIATLSTFQEFIRGAMEFYATWLTEHLGVLFLGLNKVICERYQKSRGPGGRIVKYPRGTSSDAIRDLYGSTLVFQSYPEHRILQFTPTTWRFLKKDYVYSKKTG